MATGTICEKIELLLFDSVLHIATGAVDFVVKLLRVSRLRGEDKSSVCPQVRVLGFDDVAAFATSACRRIVTIRRVVASLWSLHRRIRIV